MVNNYKTKKLYIISKTYKNKYMLIKYYYVNDFIFLLFLQEIE